MTAPANPPRPARPGRRPPIRPLVIGLVLLVVIGYAVYAAVTIAMDPGEPGAGDCVTGGTGEELKVADCSDATADYKVLGKVDGKTRDDFDADGERICRPYQGTTRAYWEGGAELRIGHVLCLAPNR
jgi:hypothetical protein